MAHTKMLEAIREWLVNQSLQDTDITALFEGLCARIRAAGIPVCRARLVWPTLHPLYGAETLVWDLGSPASLERFPHQDQETRSWSMSPLKHVVTNDLTLFRRQLQGPNELLDFEVLHDLKESGMTDYILLFTKLSMVSTPVQNFADNRGILLSWATDRPTGFSGDDLKALQSVQGRLAVTCKTVIQSRVSHNIVHAYLGQRAGNRVMQGQIRRGDGDITKAVVWYSDMRNSTGMSESMSPQEYIDLLNSYFEATAGSVIAAKGEVLDFIGDAVLAIFPFEGDEELGEAAAAATNTTRNALDLVDKVNQQRKEAGKLPFEFGIGISVGEIMFGNIGIPSRLSFSVIGHCVNQASRIQDLTKKLQTPVLASKAFAQLNESEWEEVGRHKLSGIEAETDLFSFCK